MYLLIADFNSPPLVNASIKRISLQLTKPALDRIPPRRTRRQKVKLEAMVLAGRV